jgi:hypothetical protein
MGRRRRRKLLTPTNRRALAEPDRHAGLLTGADLMRMI